jgi:hypothetical protein
MTFAINTQVFTAGEKLLWEFGVSSPEEIDLDAIAFDCGLTIRHRPLEGADARLVAFENRGVITVNSLQSAKRQRFSIGHELSHWLYDRSISGDEMIACNKDDVSPRNQAARGKEADANRFSADLVLPPYLVIPRTQSRETNINLAIELADEFNVSLPAAAIRIVRHAKQPAAVVVHRQEGIAWKFKNLLWPDYEQLAPQIHHESPAMDLLFAGSVRAKTQDRKEPAARWVYGNGMFGRQVIVQSIKRFDEQILSIVRLTN